MANYLNQSTMTLLDRLAYHTGFKVEIDAGAAGSFEPGQLEKTGRQFIRVNGNYINPASLRQITLLGFPPQLNGNPVYVRTLARSSFPARLVRTGVDFIELLATRNGDEEWLLIPMQQLVSLEKANG